ncbi:MAG: sulfatase [Chitinophagaceae bacterium]
MFYIKSFAGKRTEKVSNRKQKALNILFIAVDDLRPELACYGNSQIISPNIDKLAANGILFERAYCQQAVCSPSRTSLLTGLRPDSTHIYDLQTHFRKAVPDVVTLPQYFKQNGYHTEWWGKIFHAALLDSISWTTQGQRYEPESNWRAYVSAESERMAEKNKGGGPAFEKANVPDNAYPDGKIADNAINSLKRLKNNDKPFFLAVGFYKPHLPFNAPAKYWDLYIPASINLPAHMYPPKNAPEIAMTNWGELRAYSGIPSKGNLTKEQTIQLIHGYRACVSYTDAQVGRLLAELKNQGLDKNTIVILWGDHGWKLGDYGAWAKHTNYEIDARVPLIVSVPGMKAKGKKTKALVELVDLYPSLCELTGLPVPEHLQGISFVPVINNHELPWKKAAFSQYPRGNLMGYSIRTERFRLTRWQKSNNPDEVAAVELYDLLKDPKGLVNIADQPENQQLIKQLGGMMKQANIGTKQVPGLLVN